MPDLKRITALCLCLALARPPGVLAGEKLDAMSAPRRPDWVSKPPPASGGLVYFVGLASRADTIEDGRDAAFKDAARQIAETVGIKVSGRLVIRRDEVESRILDELRAVSRGDLAGARVGTIYWELVRTGGLLRRSGFFRIWILVAFPEAQVREERARLRGLRGAFESGVDDLCQSATKWLRRWASRKSVTVAGFRELSSNKPYAMSRIVESRLAECLTSSRVRVVQGKNSPLLLSGSYYLSGQEDIALTATLTRMKDGARLFAKTVSIPADAVEPSWLKFEKLPEENFFAGLEKWETKRRLAVGRISVDSEPRGARVLLDGEDRGRTPAGIPQVAVGVHALALVLEGHELWSRSIRVEPDHEIPVSAKLERKKGVLEVDSDPPVAEVLVDGVRGGVTPLRLELEIGAHTVEARKPKHEARTVAVEIRHGRVERRKLTLPPKPGGVAFVSDPEGAEVFLDGEGRPRGRTPLKIEKVAAGKHSVVMARAGHGRWSGSFEVSPLEMASVTGTLEKVETGQVLVRAEPPGAALWIDDERKIEFIGLGLYDLSPGKHLVRLEKAGYRAWKKKVTVKAGGFRSLRAELNPLAYSPTGEPLQWFKGWWGSGDERTPVRNRTRDRSRFNIGTKNKALLLGLLFPGAGYSVGNEGLRPYEVKNRRLNAKIVMIGSLAFVGLGAGVINSKPKSVGKPASNGHQRTDAEAKRNLGHLLLGLAGATHLFGAINAGMTANPSWSLSAGPERDGANFSISKRF